MWIDKIVRIFLTLYLLHCTYADNTQTIDQNATIEYANKSFPGKFQELKGRYSVCVASLEQLAYADLQLAKWMLDKRQKLKGGSKLWKRIDKHVLDVRGGLFAFPAIENRSESWLREQAREVSHHPLSSFRLVYRFVLKFPKLREKLKKKFDDEFKKFLPEFLPKEEDLSKISKSISGLMDIYGISVPEIINGTLLNFETGIGLDLVHCIELAQAFAELQKEANAIQLEMAAWDKIDRDNDKSMPLSEVLYHLQESIHRHNAFLRNASAANDPHLFSKKLPDMGLPRFREKIELEAKRYNQERRRQTALEYEKIRRNFTRARSSADVYYNHLCAGRSFLEEAEKSKLFCWYEWQKHPFYYIGPMKMEFLSRKPDVVQIYEVIGPKAIEKLLVQAEGKYERGQVSQASSKLGSPEDIFEGPDYKISMDMHAYKWPNVTFDVSKAEAHMNLLARLPPIDKFKIGVYAFGGKFLSHHDSLYHGEYRGPHGDRLAVFMLYLSSVISGGRTAFPLVGTASEPVKGSAMLWYNLLGNGLTDFSMYHGGCPILLGRKYIMTFHHFFYDNLLTQPCPLVNGARYQILVNGKLDY